MFLGLRKQAILNTVPNVVDYRRKVMTDFNHKQAMLKACEHQAKDIINEMQQKQKQRPVTSIELTDAELLQVLDDEMKDEAEHKAKKPKIDDGQPEVKDEEHNKEEKEEKNEEEKEEKEQNKEVASSISDQVEKKD